MKIFIKNFISKCDQTADLVAFTEKVLSRKLHFCVAISFIYFQIALLSLNQLTSTSNLFEFNLME